MSFVANMVAICPRVQVSGLLSVAKYCHWQNVPYDGNTVGLSKVA